VHYRLKTPYRDGTTHILLEPLDLLARLAALEPPTADAVQVHVAVTRAAGLIEEARFEGRRRAPLRR
jgi:hypothetical protein